MRVTTPSIGRRSVEQFRALRAVPRRWEAAPRRAGSVAAASAASFRGSTPVSARRCGPLGRAFSAAASAASAPMAAARRMTGLLELHERIAGAHVRAERDVDLRHAGGRGARRERSHVASTRHDRSHRVHRLGEAPATRRRRPCAETTGLRLVGGVVRLLLACAERQGRGDGAQRNNEKENEGTGRFIGRSGAP